VAARSVISWGLDAMGATIKDNVADGRFLAWLGQFQWARRLSDAGSQFIFGLNAQMARDPLLPMEKFAVGGMATVRGYRENLLVRDNGLTASMEFMIPLFQYGEGLVQAAPFAQYGRSWNTRGGTPDPDSIYSVGAGAIWDITKNTRLQAYYGYPLVKIEHGQGSLQEKGFHFLLTSELY
jgi:hemolysin activation/secretion protein